MNYWQTLSQAMESTCQSGRIGTPVFVRWTIVLSNQPEPIRDILAALAVYVDHWLSASASRVYSLGSIDFSQLSVSLEYPSGVGGLLCLTLGPGQPQVDLTILGSGGAIYHTEFLQPVDDASFIVQTSGQNRTILQAIERSLLSGQPVAVEQEAT